MATFIVSGSRGTDDPTMATLPFMAAKVAKEQGHEVVLWLWNDAVTLGRNGIAGHVPGGNLTPLKDVFPPQYPPTLPSGSPRPRTAPSRRPRATRALAPPAAALSCPLSLVRRGALRGLA